MPVAQQRLGLLAGQLDHVLRHGRAEDVVEPGNAHQLLQGRRVRDDDRVVLILPRGRESLRLHGRHDLARHGPDADDFAHRLVGAEELVPYGGADDADRGGAVDVVLREGGPFVDRPALDVEVLR